jgi:23S rRNA (uracil1939-C5)-methyltransferase
MNSSATSDQARSSPLEVEIERILPGGVGLAHAEGLTLFVSLAAPGDVVSVEINRVQGKVAFASIKRIIKPSPFRVEPPCKYFSRCGGCDFQQLSYEAQLKAKVEMIRDCLRRIAHIQALPEIEIHPATNQWHYRGRANWQVNSQTKSFGYFERGSHRICDVEYCAVLIPELQQTLEELRAQLHDGLFSEELKDIEAVSGDDGVSLAASFSGFPTTEVSRQIGDETYRLNARAFFQINYEMLRPLITQAIGEAFGQLAVDLYCGVGLFTIPLARRFERVVGIEANSTASGFARSNLENAQLLNARIITSAVGEWLQESPEKVEGVDFVLLDPPRAGAENAVIEGILRLRSKRISYVSCDPATLARDLKKLLAGGYALDSVVAFDMFPQTHHVETVCVLERAATP